MTSLSWWTAWSTIFSWFILLPLEVLMLASPEHGMLDANPDYPLLNSSACLLSHGQDDRRLLMACPAGHLVKLVRLIYGHSESTSRCHLLPGDCVTHLVARGNEVTCVGLNRCDVRVTSRDHRRPIPGCQLPTNYIHTSFQCIPESVVVDICNMSSGRHGQQQQQPQRGYLRSPFYPQPYPDTADCVVNLTAAGRGQRVRLYVVDLQLGTAGTGCAGWINVFDGLKSITLCGSRARRLLATSARQQLQVRFHSNRQRRLKGFWLYYEVVPSAVDSLPSLTTSTSSTSYVSLAVTSSRHRDAFESAAVVDDSAITGVTTFRHAESRDRVVQPAVSTAQPFPLVAETLLAVVISLFASCSIILFIVFVFMLVRRRTSTTSPSQSPNSQEQQQQQHPRSNVVQSIFSVVDVTPKNNIEKSLQQHHQYQTAGRDRGTNCSGAGEVCSCSPEGETVVQTTSLTTPSTLKCTSALAKTSNDSQNTLRTRFSQEV